MSLCRSLYEQYIFILNLSITTGLVKMEIDDFIDVIKLITSKIPKNVKWAIDGSTSLALQGIDLKPHDIDILTNSEGALAINESLREYNVKPVTHSSNQKYDSFYGIFEIGGIKVEVMGDMKVFRNGEWSKIQNPDTINIVQLVREGFRIPVVSLQNQKESGYLDERRVKGRSG